MAQGKWRLKKTLERKVEVNPVELDDLAHAWAAYKVGQWPFFEPGLDAEGFRSAFATLAVNAYNGMWVIKMDTKRGFVPVAYAFGWWFHPNTEDVMILDRFAWMPWVTPRQMITALVGFVTRVRKDLKMFSFCPPNEKKIMEIVAKHGVIRRVGTSHILYGDGEPATMWETR